MLKLLLLEVVVFGFYKGEWRSRRGVVEYISDVFIYDEIEVLFFCKLFCYFCMFLLGIVFFSY